MIQTIRRIWVGAAILASVTAALAGASRQRAVRPGQLMAAPTFSAEVVRIFQTHCQSCHHPGDIAPFSLVDYDSARRYAKQIKMMTQSGRMPPWKPSPGCGDFTGARTLSRSEIDTLARWSDNGAPEGDRASLPPPLDFSSGWTLGPPDLVLSYPEPFTPSGSGDTYRCLPLPTGLPSDRYVSAIDVHPGDRRSVHHVIAFIDKNGDSTRLDASEPGPGYTCFGGPGFAINDPGAATLGGWAPGTVAARLPKEVGFALPGNSRVVLQIHYHSHDGLPQPDQTEIGIYLAEKKPQQLLYLLPLINDGFTIPPNDPDFRVVAPPGGSFTTPVGVHLWAIFPHMHLLGRRMTVQSQAPDGALSCLINIDDWDFNWQGMYQYRTPLAIPAGSRLSAIAFYDNSTGNASNPNVPPRPVSWGEQTTDEMCIAFLAFTVDAPGSANSGEQDLRWVPGFGSRN